VLPFARAIDREAELQVCCLKSIGGNPIEQRLREAAVPVINLGARNLRDIRAFRRLITLLREQRIQLVHAHLTYAAIWGAIAARVAGIRAVATLHVAPAAGGWRDRVREWLMMRVLRWSGSRVIAVSEAVRHAFQSRYPAPSMEVIHNGVEVEAFERRNALRSTELRHEFGFAENAPVVVTVSVLRAGKGIDVLLRALHHVDAQLLVVGEGPMRTAWSVLADKRVVWAGYRDDVPRLLAGADLFVLPSLDDAFPTVLLEAMAAELPVVATQVGGIPEIVDSAEVGVLVPPGDVSALAAAIEALLGDDERRGRTAAAGRRRVEEEFSTQRWTERLMTLYRSAQ
jgi:glycosyltransferase involved in cell wall biosynthesis